MVKVAIGWSKIEVFSCFFATFYGIEVLNGTQKICRRESAVRHCCRFHCH